MNIEKILFLTDDKNIKLNNLKHFFNYKIDVKTLDEIENYDYNLIFFAMKHPIEIIKSIKKHSSNFITIVVIENNKDYINDLSEESYHKIDGKIFINQINDETYINEFLENKLLSAKKIHFIKKEYTLGLLDKFVSVTENKDENVLYTVEDITGKIITVNKKCEQVFKDIIGYNISEMELFINGKKINDIYIYNESLKPNDLVTVVFKGITTELKLLSIFKIENGTTYYVKEFELLKDIEHQKALLQKLTDVHKQIKNSV